MTRNEEILEEYKATTTLLKDIAKKHKISVQRVRQVLYSELVKNGILVVESLTKTVKDL